MTTENTPKKRRTFAEFFEDNFVPIGLGIASVGLGGFLTLVKISFDQSNAIQQDSNDVLNQNVKEAMDAGKISLYPSPPEVTTD